MTLRWIFFDVGSTLVDETEAYDHRVRDMIADTNISFEEFDDVRIALAKCSAEESVMVGDRLDNDIIPAKALGMENSMAQKRSCEISGCRACQRCRGSSDQLTIRAASNFIKLTEIEGVLCQITEIASGRYRSNFS